MSYNVKHKIYPNGYMNITYCNKCIFDYPKEKKLYKGNGDGDKSAIVKDKKQYNTSSENAVLHDDSLKRAKDKVFDIAFCNEWNYFLTITFNDEIVNAKDIPLVMGKLRNWLSDSVKRKGLKYLLLPEYHKKGNRIHCHALVNDVLDFKPSGTYIVPNYKKPVSEDTIYNWISEGKEIDINQCHEVLNCFNWKYGFSTAIGCYGTPEKLASYVTKYITKDIKKIFGKYYWSSRNIVRNPDIKYSVSTFSNIEAECYTGCENAMYFKYVFERGEGIE